tara:strand:+ start:2699 stop:3253 length:555 start_codon:yes stop_codon:yes gene_type:complete
MESKSLENYLKSWAGKVVSQSKSMLQSQKGSTALGDSIDFKVEQDPNGWSVKFYMLDYGTFLDKGVSGNKVKRNFTNYKLAGETSPYSYKSKGPPIDILSKWVKKKGLKPKGWGKGRDKKSGRYVSGLAIYISHKIKEKGIPSLSFFSKPFGTEYSNLGEGILKALKLDITTYITTFTKHKPKK